MLFILVYRLKWPMSSLVTIRFIVGTHVYLPPPRVEGARGLGRLIWLKYNVQKWQIILTLGLNAAKNTDFMEKASSKSCLELNSSQRGQWRTCLSPPSFELWGSEGWYGWNIHLQKWPLIFTWAERCEKYRFYGKKLQVKVA